MTLLGRAISTTMVLATAMAAAADQVSGQVDSAMAQGGIYARPFIGSISTTSVGGYVEGNSNYFVEDGLAEGFSMELRRFNLFLFSQISQRVRFISELEFEHGTEEIALETALVDLEVSPALVIRAGIILPPLGFFNQNHDSPRWDFIERPLVATDVVPSTLSEVGGGLYGRVAVGGGLLLSYDVYMTNGLGDGVIANGVGRTDIRSGRREEQFGGDNNTSPALSARVALRVPGLGEAGVSRYAGYYNSHSVEGQEVDDARWLSISALDFGGAIGPADVRGELAYASVEVPPSLVELFGEMQWGGHFDVVIPVWHPRVPGYDDAVISAAFRVERVDYNVGSFSSTEEPIRDDLTAVVSGLTFRPSPGTVFRANYRYHWARDFVGNDTVRRAGFQLGFATYF